MMLISYWGLNLFPWKMKSFYLEDENELEP